MVGRRTRDQINLEDNTIPASYIGDVTDALWKQFLLSAKVSSVEYSGTLAERIQLFLLENGITPQRIAAHLQIEVTQAKQLIRDASFMHKGDRSYSGNLLEFGGIIKALLHEKPEPEKPLQAQTSASVHQLLKPILFSLQEEEERFAGKSIADTIAIICEQAKVARDELREKMHKREEELDAWMERANKEPSSAAILGNAVAKALTEIEQERVDALILTTEEENKLKWGPFARWINTLGLKPEQLANRWGIPSTPKASAVLQAEMLMNGKAVPKKVNMPEIFALEGIKTPQKQRLVYEAWNKQDNLIKAIIISRYLGEYGHRPEMQR